MLPKMDRNNLNPQISGLLAYLIPPVTSFFILILERDNKELKFHAWQGILLGGFFYTLIFALEVISTLIGMIATYLGIMIGLWIPLIILAGIVLWATCLYRVYNEETWKIPYLGDYAEKWSGLKK
jgi:uncharacterized membrane protein